MEDFACAAILYNSSIEHLISKVYVCDTWQVVKCPVDISMKGYAVYLDKLF